MPELPEVETVCQGLRPVMEGSVITQVEQNRKNLRIPFPDKFVERLENSKVTSLWRRAKYILVELDTGDVLLMHLGMSGRFTIYAPQEMRGDKSGQTPGTFHHGLQPAERGPHDHVIFHMDNGSVIIYTDPRRFGLMTLIEPGGMGTHKLLKDIGIEPLGNELSGDFLLNCFKGKKTNLKAALLDQRNVAGLGNIYVCEALFRARLSPERAGASLATLRRHKSQKEKPADVLAQTIRSVLSDAVAAGGSSLNDYAQTNGELGYFQHSFDVYGREGDPCKRDGCKGTINRIVQSGRSSFFCPRCQR